MRSMHPPGDRGLLLERPLNIFPNAAAHGLLMRNLNPPRHFIILLNPNIHRVARGDADLTFTVLEFGDGGGNFRLQTKVDDDLSVRYLKNLTLHNLSRHKGSRRKRLHARKQVRHVTAFGSARGERDSLQRVVQGQFQPPVSCDYPPTTSTCLPPNTRRRLTGKG